MKQKLIVAAIGILAMFTLLYGAGTTVNGTRIINGDLTVKGTCTGCGGGLTIGSTTVSSGTSGAFLYNNAGTLGNVAVVPGANGGNQVLLEQHTASASATLDFTTCISSTYDEYLLEMVGLLNATNDQSLVLQVGTGAGPTWDTGSNYKWGQGQNGGGGGFNNQSSSDTSIQVAHTARNTSGYTVSGSIKAFAPQGTIFKMFTYQSEAFSSDNNFYSNIGAGVYIQTTALTGFRFFFASGNITSGTIRCYGIAKA